MKANHARRTFLRSSALAGAMSLTMFAGAMAADDRTYQFDMPAQPLGDALRDFARAAGEPIVFREDLTAGRTAPAIRGAYTADQALDLILADAGLKVMRSRTGVYMVQDPQGGSAGGGADDYNAVDALIVTAQKKEEQIQDVPIAISAFTQKSLDAQKLEGGFDLLKAIPNVTFSKTNFSGYNFQIRGIGTQAVSATTDPGVAVSYNNTTLIVNRLFEQEYVDMERVEVLRGPQGTLYGRNATAGVINVITAKPRMMEFEGEIKLETGNYNAQRVRGHLNIPIGEQLAVRGAFAMTKRDGYGFNEASLTNDTREFGDIVREDVDGRDLWTGRITVGWEPNERFRANLMWERFEEDDNRVRTSKQLCHRDDGTQLFVTGEFLSPENYQRSIDEGSITPDGFINTNNYQHSALTQACRPGSLYAEEAFGTPNGASLPYVSALYHVVDQSRTFLASFTREVDDTYGLGFNRWHPSQWADPNTPPAGLPCRRVNSGSEAVGNFAGTHVIDVCNPDVYGGLTQSRDLRSIYSELEPIYRAKADVFDLSFDYDWTDSLTFSSQTVYVRDDSYASQDYNRFRSLPLWTDTRTNGCGFAAIIPGFPQFGTQPDCSNNPDTGIGTHAPLTDADGDGVVDQTRRPVDDDQTVDADGFLRDQDGGRIGFYRELAPNGVFCDPQLGCSDSLVARDLIEVSSKQFNQEFRLASSFEGPWNFSLGSNFTKFETMNDYYVFINALTYLTNLWPFNSHDSPCITQGTFCRYVDPNSLESINGEGHNYFRSANPYELTSQAIFGELYWQATETLKVTAGLRYTWDRKVFIPMPSQLLLADYREITGTDRFEASDGAQLGDGPDVCYGPNGTLTNPLHCPIMGTAPGGRGLVAEPDIVQEWREPTGRIIVDWKPDLGFTDDSMFYASYSHGYKGGGANPPSIAEPAKHIFELASGGTPATFDAEYVDAYELGTKNTLLDGALILNGSAFYYDYKDYQVSKIADRRAVNENFDATIWGLELEWIYNPTRNLRFNGTVGHLRTKIGDGEQSIDLIDRANGGNQFFANPDGAFPDGFSEWVVVQPWITAAANCVVPRQLLDAAAASFGGGFQPWFHYCPGGGILGSRFAVPYFDENGNVVTQNDSGRSYNPAVDAPNGGAGFYKDLGGNELPNAPQWTFSFGAQYRMALPGGWDATLRTDFYWQDKSYARVYNMADYDRLRSWTNTNLSLWIENPDWGVKAEVYAKNLFEETPITGAFLNSEDSGLTTNVFTLDPRLIGVSVTKSF